jgi:hypothetical protein
VLAPLECVGAACRNSSATVWSSGQQQGEEEHDMEAPCRDAA